MIRLIFKNYFCCKNFSTNRKLISSYVYFLRNSGTEQVKIGRTKNIDNRIKQLQTGNSGKLFYDFYIETSNSNLLEKTLHKKFSDKRIRGEWFKISQNESLLIKNQIIKKTKD